MTLIETLTSTLGLKSWLKAADKPMSSQENSGCAEDGPQDPFFNDAAFDKVIEEMDKPDFTGFELFADTRGVQIHRRPEGDSGLYEYKIIGYQPDVDPKVCALVNMDLEYRKKWDSYVSKLEVLKEYKSGHQLLYWQVAYPFPLTNRDYFYMRRCKEMAFTTKGKQQTAWVTISRCMPPDLQLCPETSALRVDEYKQTMAITTHESGQGSRLYMNTFDNPKGSIPTWLINYFASSGVASYLDSVKKAVENYKK